MRLKYPVVQFLVQQFEEAIIISHITLGYPDPNISHALFHFRNQQLKIIISLNSQDLWSCKMALPSMPETMSVGNVPLGRISCTRSCLSDVQPLNSNALPWDLQSFSTVSAYDFIYEHVEGTGWKASLMISEKTDNNQVLVPLRGFIRKDRPQKFLL